MENSIVISLMIILIIVIIDLIIKIRRLKRETEKQRISILFLDALSDQATNGPSIDVLGHLDSETLTEYKERLISFYLKNFFNNNFAYQKIGICLTSINRAITDKDRVATLEDIFIKALQRAETKDLAGIIARIIWDKDVLECSDDLGIREKCENFILNNIHNNKVSSFVTELEKRINLLMMSREVKADNEAVAQARIIIIKKRLADMKS
ncbi:MAG: hypothetical protein WCK59_00650 [Candidatus Falkowbacteria bacterium]